jgi:hypothetical protein
VAGTFTPGGGGTPTTWVPLTDLDGSTIALVNAASPDSGPVTSFVYDPSGAATVNGASDNWPFRYQGMEHLPTDPAQLDFDGSGSAYDPQIQRNLSAVGEMGTSGSGRGGA